VLVVSATSPNILALFGTGQYISSNDNNDLTEQSFYGVWDAGSAHGGLERSNLAEQVILGNTTNIDLDGNGTDDTLEIRTIADQVDNPTQEAQSKRVTFSTAANGSNFGWYMDLQEYSTLSSSFEPLEGERSILRPFIFGEVLLFVTNTPNSGFCEGGGTSFVMAVNSVDGSQPSFAPFDIDGDGFDDNFSFGSQKFLQAPNVLSKGGGIGSSPTSGGSASIGGPVDGFIPTVVGSAFRGQGRKSWSIIR